MTGRAWIRRAILALALLALGVRVAAPPGYMLAEDARGGIVIAFCNGEHAVLDPVSGKLSDPAQHSKAGTDGHCLFAAAPTPAPAAEGASLMQPYAAFFANAARPAPARIGAGLAAPPPPATGPPLLS